MRAVVYTRYGPPDVLHLAEVDKPVPQNDDVLIKVHAAAINSRDWRLMRANPFFIRLAAGGLLAPKLRILGADLAGRVEAVGNNIQEFQPGDEVFGYLPITSGRGTFAEYACATEDEITRKPANVTFEQAAAVPLAATTALQALRDEGTIRPGQKVLIYGASGGVGTFALQLAKAFGAEVTAVCSTRNVDMARTLGANHVIDYRKEDLSRSRELYDLILAVNGYHPISHYLQALCPEGVYVVAGGSVWQFFEASLQSRRSSATGSKNIRVAAPVHNQKDLLLLKDLLESGKLVPVIDHCYPLSQTAEAFRYFEKVHAQGKVVITVQQAGG